MSGFARTLHVLLLGIWLGAAIFFVGAAQKAAAMIDSKHFAGDVITANLDLIETYGLWAGPIILVTLFGWTALQQPLRTRVLGAMLMIAAILMSRYWTTPAMVEAKAAMGMRLENMDPQHPLVQQFQYFHVIGSSLHLLHLVVCFFMLIAAVRSSKPRRSFGGIEL